jgi:uncharacterized protein (TIGR02246 family)
MFMTGAQTQSADASAKEAIEAVIASTTDAWNKGNPLALSAACAEDVSFTNVIGSVYYGRTAFEHRHAELLRSIFKGSTLKQSVGKLLFIREDVAIADVNTELRGYTRLPPGIQTGDDDILRTRLQLVLAKEQGEWRIIAFHNVAVAPLPAHR